MSGLALLLARTGVTITASDQNDSPYLRKLAEKGITTWVGSAPARIDNAAHVYYSSAIKPEDPERSAAEKQGMRCEPRHALLAAITREYFTIAVAGCHGKTTTSAWIASLLEAAGLDPTALIGGTVPAWNSNYREGRGELNGKPILVIEADESDRSFLSIASQVALITNIDLDHTDVHASLATLTADFKQFATGALNAGGWIHLSKECGNDLVAWSSEAEHALWEKISLRPDEHALIYGGKQFKIGLAGKHNLMNATLVLQLGVKLGIDSAVMAEVLQNFSGVNRRMQKLAEFPELYLTVIDDYAHHPHEVASTLAALRPQYERLIVFWEPHRLSRFSHFHHEFEAALQPYTADGVVIALPVFASGDKPADYPEVAGQYQKFTRSPYRAIATIADLDLVSLNLKSVKTAAVFMGAGKSSDYAKEFVDLVTSHGQ
jgi:UDP-N-acetylmuramate--alanine ligase